MPYCRLELPPVTMSSHLDHVAAIFYKKPFNPAIVQVKKEHIALIAENQQEISQMIKQNPTLLGRYQEQIITSLIG
jgi:hypothetical protein